VRALKGTRARQSPATRWRDFATLVGFGAARIACEKNASGIVAPMDREASFYGAVTAPSTVARETDVSVTLAPANMWTIVPSRMI